MKHKSKAVFGGDNKIPQMFYLRKVWTTVRTMSGDRMLLVLKPVHMFWSYRDSLPRILDTPSREEAKQAIITGKLKVLDPETHKAHTLTVCKPNPDADFFRY